MDKTLVKIISGAIATCTFGVGALMWVAVSLNSPWMHPAIMAAVCLAVCVLFFVVVLHRLCDATAEWSKRHKPRLDAEVLLVLGCRLNWQTGSPMGVLRGRLDKAMWYRQQQVDAGSDPAKIVCSGGQGHDEPTTEAGAMRSYLVEHGVPVDCIVEEDKSTNTIENMRFSKPLIDGRRTVLCTSDYHILRSQIIASWEGVHFIDCIGSYREYKTRTYMMRDTLAIAGFCKWQTLLCAIGAIAAVVLGVLGILP